MDQSDAVEALTKEFLPPQAKVVETVAAQPLEPELIFKDAVPKQKRGLPIRIFTWSILAICLAMFFGTAVTYPKTEFATQDFNSHMGLFLLFTIFFTAMVCFLGQLDFATEDHELTKDDTTLAKVVLFWSWVATVVMLTMFSKISNILDTDNLCRIVPVVFVLGIVFMWKYSKDWFWEGDCDYIFGKEVNDGTPTSGIAAFLGPWAAMGVYKLFCWWLPKAF